jgi:predicted nucleic acid-binding protein
MAVNKLYNEGAEIFTTFQNCAEFWNVATRPKKYNGFGIEHREAHQMLSLVDQLFPILWHTKDSYLSWRKIVAEFEVSGVQVHDARLVAVMLAHGVERILTFNDQDFRRFEPAGIEAVHPSAVLS